MERSIDIYIRGGIGDDTLAVMLVIILRNWIINLYSSDDNQMVIRQFELESSHVCYSMSSFVFMNLAKFIWCCLTCLPARILSVNVATAGIEPATRGRVFMSYVGDIIMIICLMDVITIMRIISHEINIGISHEICSLNTGAMVLN